jgi:3-deoxy-manno-octulosonate cytidylyltransferase (CMP-KDO synthetase)
MERQMNLNDSVVLIPARYKSTRLPGKPLELIGGIPMVVRVAGQAKQSKADEVIVVTDDDRIVAVCQKNGIDTIKTSGEFSNGTERIASIIDQIDAQNIVNVQGDEPFISPLAIDKMVTALKTISNQEPAFLVAIRELKNEDELSSKSSVKAVLNDAEDRIVFCTRFPYKSPGNDGARLGFRVLGLYGYTKDFLRDYSSGRSYLENVESIEQMRAVGRGMPLKPVKVEDAGFSVDTFADLRRARQLCFD